MKMKIITYILLALVLISLFFLVACDSTPPGGDPSRPVEDEDTGIDDVFDDTEGVTPPPTPP